MGLTERVDSSHDSTRVVQMINAGVVVGFGGMLVVALLAYRSILKAQRSKVAEPAVGGDPAEDSSED